MPTEADFIRAVIAAPDDDAPRLVYADWLDEQGQDERAEFISVQCAVPVIDARLDIKGSRHNHGDTGGKGSPNCQRCRDLDAIDTLRRRERELLGDEARQGQWAGSPLSMAHAHSMHPICWPWQFRRGFVESVTCTALDWLAHADAILQAQPVREVTLSTYPPTPAIRSREGIVGLECNYLGTSRWVQFGAARNVLPLVWPSVKTWHLPPAEGPEGYAHLRSTVAEAIREVADRVTADYRSR